MELTLEYKFKPGDKLIAQVEHLLIPVKVLKLDGFDNYSDILIAKYTVESLGYNKNFENFMAFETDL